ncbi:Calcium-binding EF-hand family protein isoform 1 [Melia azedarach]|uniref:Calcium-binding EF-hand family protein isoform 1 n=1 Tax=Melia azedarach TaxID=155640 RepID=A0ACC1Y415_MELAZ|nr:Calcium-binding EF-hand family protein isoform 1 [Melia azedarach]
MGFLGSSPRVLRDSEASGSNEAAQKSLLKYSRSRVYDYSGKGKEILQANGVEELNERLKILEEETEAMKQAFIETMEERKKLVNEIYQDFLKIHHRRHFGNQVTEVKVLDRSLIVNPSNEAEMGSGLLQVLCEDSNPCIVTRDHRANMHFRLFS